MGKILVIQPHKMLQQAIALSFFPEHEVQIAKSISESPVVTDFDVIIVDASSFRETNELAGQEIRAVQSWKVPTIWIEGAESSQTPRRDRLVVVNRPMGKEALHSALAACLGLPSGSKRNATATAQDRQTRDASAEENKAGVAAAIEGAAYIELVDVVEEATERTTSKTRQKK